MPQILKSRCNFTLKCLLDLGSTSLEQNLSLKTLGYLFFIPMTNFWLLSGKRFDLTHPMVITALRLFIFGQNVIGRVWVSIPNWVFTEILAQIAGNTFPKLASSFYKMWKCLQYPKQPKCPMFNAQNVWLKTLAFADESNQWEPRYLVQQFP